MKAVRIALVQQKASADRDANIQRGHEAVDRAAADGANIICFAELAFDRFYPQRHATPETLSLAEPIPGPTTNAFAEQAARLGVVVVLNLFERDGARTFDSSPVIDADGSLLGVTRMIHITDYEHFHERGYYAPGDTGAPVFDTKFGRIGIAICYDRHFPEYMRALAIRGAQIVVTPQAGAVGEWPAGLYEAEMRVAAFQNGYFTALCNRVGREEHLTFGGESFVCGPDGQVLARAAEGSEETLVCDLKLATAAETPAHRLFLKDRRPDLYKTWFADPK